MKKFASLFVSLLLVCFTLVGAASPANAYAGFSESGSGTGPGPRVQFGTNDNPDQYMTIGAYNNSNNIDTRNRPLIIYSSYSDKPISIIIDELLPIAPAGANYPTVVINPYNGKLYMAD
ncbi:hypothetical protein [Moorena sp. SIO4G3]|uniref:hypothetical protein n=1 Tax=Moorena sp. SIO4G3 TaxID=2607821 RepID=UPI00142BFC9B|nr:hypothetical protein [Moorena sp. SIO4G3]NEO77094.1 hypothetical protein [Moorena sp. SIO4G3]